MSAEEMVVKIVNASKPKQLMMSGHPQLVDYVLAVWRRPGEAELVDNGAAMPLF